MLCQHLLVAGTPAQIHRTSDLHRVTATSWTARVVLLVDALVDLAHRDGPGESGVLHLPTGESMFIPRHRADDPACGPDHTGYFHSRVRPHCAADPIPRRRGSSGLRPVILELYSPHAAAGSPVVRYRLDLRTGDLTADHRRPATTADHRS